MPHSAGARRTALGTRTVIAAGLTSVAVGVAVVGAGAFAGSGPLTALGLGLFGLGMGGAEIAMNIDGAEVERIMERADCGDPVRSARLRAPPYGRTGTSFSSAGSSLPSRSRKAPQTTGCRSSWSTVTASTTPSGPRSSPSSPRR